MDINRRTVLTSAAWTAPAVVVAKATPAYAVSNEPTFSCKVSGWFKTRGPKKDYYVLLECTDPSQVTSVEIYDDVDKIWRKAELMGGSSYIWVAYNFNDKRRRRTVRVNGGQFTTVAVFAPSN